MQNPITTLLPLYRQTLPERFAALILFSGSFHGRMRVPAGFRGWHGICYRVIAPRAYRFDHATSDCMLARDSIGLDCRINNASV